LRKRTRRIDQVPARSRCAGAGFVTLYFLAVMQHTAQRHHKHEPSPSALAELKAKQHELEERVIALEHHVRELQSRLSADELEAYERVEP
jgi:hypothetical protein